MFTTRIPRILYTYIHVCTHTNVHTYMIGIVYIHMYTHTHVHICMIDRKHSDEYGGELGVSHSIE